MPRTGSEVPGSGSLNLRQHAIPVGVAASIVAVAAAGGGYGTQLRALVSIAVWWAVIGLLAFGFGPRARVPRAALVAGSGLLALALLAVLSTGWASDDGTAFREALRPLLYAGVFALVVLLSSPGSASRWLAGLAIGLTGVGVLAVGSRVEPSLFPEQDLVTFIPSVATRLSYPLNYWNGLGACMALAVVLLLWQGAHARTAAGRALAVGFAPVPGLALFLTSSRGGVAALLSGLVVLIVVAPARARLLAGGLVAGAGAGLLIAFANSREAFVDGRVDAPGAGTEGTDVLLATILVVVTAAVVRLAIDRPVGRLRVPAVVAAASAVLALVAAVIAVAAADPGERIDKFKEPPAAPGPTRGFVTRHLASAEGNGRYQFWETALDAFSAEPLRGVGAGGYEAWWAEKGSLSYFIRDAHSLFVEIPAELGLLGLIALACFLLAPFVRGVALRARDPGAAPAAAAWIALLACGATSAAIDWTWELPAAFAPVVIAAAVLAGPALAGAPAGTPAARPRFGLGLAALAFAWAALVASAIVAAGETKLDDSRASARGGDLAAAAEDARQAHAIEPWSGAPYLQLALVLERDGDLRGARDAIRDAAERDGGDWQVWLVAARLAVKDGDVAEGRSALRRSRQLNPRSRLFAGAVPP